MITSVVIMPLARQKLIRWHGREETGVGWCSIVQVVVWYGPSASYSISFGVNLATCVELRVLGRSCSAENFERFGNGFRGRYAQVLITRKRGKTRDEETIEQIVNEKFDQRRVGVRPSPALALSSSRPFLCRKRVRG
jgi:hypothetical protein